MAEEKMTPYEAFQALRGAIGLTVAHMTGPEEDCIESDEECAEYLQKKWDAFEHLIFDHGLRFPGPSMGAAVEAAQCPTCRAEGRFFRPGLHMGIDHGKEESAKVSIFSVDMETGKIKNVESKSVDPDGHIRGGISGNCVSWCPKCAEKVLDPDDVFEKMAYKEPEILSTSTSEDYSSLGPVEVVLKFKEGELAPMKFSYEHFEVSANTEVRRNEYDGFDETGNRSLTLTLWDGNKPKRVNRLKNWDGLAHWTERVRAEARAYRASNKKPTIEQLIPNPPPGFGEVHVELTPEQKAEFSELSKKFRAENTDAVFEETKKMLEAIFEELKIPIPEITPPRSTDECDFTDPENGYIRINVLGTDMMIREHAAHIAGHYIGDINLSNSEGAATIIGDLIMRAGLPHWVRRPLRQVYLIGDGTMCDNLVVHANRVRRVTWDCVKKGCWFVLRDAPTGKPTPGYEDGTDVCVALEDAEYRMDDPRMAHLPPEARWWVRCDRVGRLDKPIEYEP